MPQEHEDMLLEMGIYELSGDAEHLAVIGNLKKLHVFHQGIYRIKGTDLSGKPNRAVITYGLMGE